MDYFKWNRVGETDAELENSNSIRNFLEICYHMKKLADYKFAVDEFQTACTCYDNIVNQALPLKTSESTLLSTNCLLNSALCHIKQHMWEKAIEKCSHIIDIIGRDSDIIDCNKAASVMILSHAIYFRIYSYLHLEITDSLRKKIHSDIQTLQEYQHQCRAINIALPSHEDSLTDYEEMIDTIQHLCINRGIWTVAYIDDALNEVRRQLQTCTFLNGQNERDLSLRICENTIITITNLMSAKLSSHSNLIHFILFRAYYTLFSVKIGDQSSQGLLSAAKILGKILINFEQNHDDGRLLRVTYLLLLLRASDLISQRSQFRQALEYVQEVIDTLDQFGSLYSDILSQVSRLINSSNHNDGNFWQGLIGPQAPIVDANALRDIVLEVFKDAQSRFSLFNLKCYTYTVLSYVSLRRVLSLTTLDQIDELSHDMSKLLEVVDFWSRAMDEAPALIELSKLSTSEIRCHEVLLLAQFELLVNRCRECKKWEFIKALVPVLIESVEILLTASTIYSHVSTNRDECAIPYNLRKNPNHLIYGEVKSIKASLYITLGHTILESHSWERGFPIDCDNAATDEFYDAVLEEATIVWELAADEYISVLDYSNAARVSESCGNEWYRFIDIQPFRQCLEPVKISDSVAFIAEKTLAYYQQSATCFVKYAEFLLHAASSMDFDEILSVYQTAMICLYKAGLVMQQCDEEECVKSFEAARRIEKEYRRVMHMQELRNCVTSNNISSGNVTNAWSSHAGFEVACGDLCFHLGCAFYRQSKYHLSSHEAEKSFTYYSNCTDVDRVRKALELTALSSYASGNMGKAEEIIGNIRRLYPAPLVVVEVEAAIVGLRSLMLAGNKYVPTKLTAPQSSASNDSAKDNQTNKLKLKIDQTFARMDSIISTECDVYKNVDFNLILSYSILIMFFLCVFIFIVQTCSYNGED